MSEDVYRLKKMMDLKVETVGCCILFIKIYSAAAARNTNCCLFLGETVGARGAKSLLRDNSTSRNLKVQSVIFKILNITCTGDRLY